MPDFAGIRAKIKSSFSHYYPLSIAGTCFAAASFFLLGRAFANGNPYPFLLSAIMLLVLVFFATFGRLQAARAAKSRIEWDASAPLYAGEKNDTHRLIFRDLRLAPFFRLHFVYSGLLSVGRNAHLNLRREISSFGDDELRISQHYPLCGILHLSGVYVIKDVFGLTRSKLKQHDSQSLTVRPALITDRDVPRIDAQKGQENKSRMKNAEIERYFMREYIPGDRQRDINWKASSRFSELFTRISPLTQEKTQVITIHFRPFSSQERESLTSVALLDRCKSVLLHFLRSAKKDHPEYHFRVIVGSDVVELEDEDEIDLFSMDVAAMHYRNMYVDPAVATSEEPSFIFTTLYDRTVNDIIPKHTDDSVYIYRAVPGFLEGYPQDHERVSFRLMNGAFYSGGSWLLRRDRSLQNLGILTGPEVRAQDELLEVTFV